MRAAGVFLVVWGLLFVGVYSRGAGGARSLLRLLQGDFAAVDRRRLCWSAAAALALAAGVTIFLK